MLPQKSPFRSNTARERDPEFFAKLHKEKLRRVRGHIKDHSIERILQKEKELTFHPNIKNPFNRKRRSVDEFIYDQVKFDF
jgi:hypothetical protein